ncbi:proprotein convertase P-domain-containing protein [Ottowia sp.]|uniref:proprotein convertase P-domain-containing protein n=1 Tax=Ottowia sp. TaxID=1898956 RepID=UPI001E0ED160|nr:proprotein convertase P-domain-containing protein [Ottowia sp.]MCB2025370.1 proprotein convertase P-domain-containing protein [Ottowia sp.]MCP5258175.1 proprotein convertase P-domain-containing protein [Burkholderiaceae bacterium]HPK31559.1 proprotein convertase P-domain-containing protein [Ottowia sp.]HRW71344.1 proprotein convertase P-domain-containing protein [Ottowia sp.]
MKAFWCAARGATRRVLAVLAVGLAAVATVALAAVDKDQTYAQMLVLAGQMASLKPQISTSPVARTQYETARGEYDRLSQLMGGDDPARALQSEQRQQARAVGREQRRQVPAVPPMCNVSSGTYTQSTPVAIPTGPGVVTSTIVVSGAGPWIWDVDVRTFIQHTFAADLDITITSPSGTVVTLTTDNGGSNDNVFNGTLWDDSAPSLVTDYVYTNLVVAPALVPEEALGAFVGENPNGTWTITVSDDLAGDGGSLDSWSLDIATLPAAPTTATTTVSSSAPVTIADLATATSSLTLAGGGLAIQEVRVTTAIRHTFAADIDMTLTSPSGTVVTLTTDNGGSNDNVFNGTLWFDKANPGGQVPYTTNDGLVTDQAYVNLVTATPLVPEGALSAFMGENPNGNWTLSITDDLAGDTGTLDSWSLEVTTATCAAPTPVQATPVPALGWWGLLLTALGCLAGVAALGRRRDV